MTVKLPSDEKFVRFSMYICDERLKVFKEGEKEDVSRYLAAKDGRR
jgi:hypothetical protein